MYQKLLKYFLESNLYFIESVDMILWFMHESNDELEINLADLAFDKLGQQGGRYTLHLTNEEIKKYLFYYSEKKLLALFFFCGLDYQKQKSKP